MLQRRSQLFSEALNAMSNSAVKRTWDRLRTCTSDQLNINQAVVHSNVVEHCLLNMIAHNRSLYLYCLYCMRYMYVLVKILNFSRSPNSEGFKCCLMTGAGCWLCVSQGQGVRVTTVTTL